MTSSKIHLEAIAPKSRIDSLDFAMTDMPFPSAQSAIDDASQNSDFSFSPPSHGSMRPFGPPYPTPFAHSSGQSTVHPDVLSSSDIPMLGGMQYPDDLFHTQGLLTSLPNARRQHGQVTPPDDQSPKSAEFNLEPHVDGDRETQMQGDTAPHATSSGGRRKRSAKAAAGGPKTRGRRSTAADQNNNLDPEEKAKRDQFLERNRLAAHKCRQKKKEWMVQLDNKCRQLAASNKLLNAQVESLGNALFELKNLVFNHADCRYKPIDDFIRSEADRVQARARAAVESATNTQGHCVSPDAFSYPAQAREPFPVYNSLDFGQPTERVSSDGSDLISFGSNSTSPGGAVNEDWIDMLQKP